MNISQIMNELTQLQQQESCWAFLLSQLEECLDSDAEAAKVQIAVPDCTVGFVTQETLAAVIAQINDLHLKVIKEEINQLQQVEVKL